jgi:hypothetical protein
VIFEDLGADAAEARPTNNHDAHRRRHR